MKVKILTIDIEKPNPDLIYPKVTLPAYQSEGASGLDMYAYLFQPLYEFDVIHNTVKGGYKAYRNTVNIDDTFEITLMPLGRCFIKTGFKVEVPQGYKLEIIPRSGLTLYHGISIFNSPACIDSDYRGEMGLIIENRGEKPFVIKHGDRLAQCMLIEVEPIEWIISDKLSKTNRDIKGLGSTGVDGKSATKVFIGLSKKEPIVKVIKTNKKKVKQERIVLAGTYIRNFKHKLTVVDSNS